jgi:hypothetical protein
MLDRCSSTCWRRAGDAAMVRGAESYSEALTLSGHYTDYGKIGVAH